MISFSLELNHKPNKNGLATIFLRLYEEKKIKRIDSGKKTFPPKFNKDAKYGNWIKGDDKNNRDLENDLNRLKEIYNDLKKENLPHNINDVVIVFFKKNISDFLNYFNQYIEDKAKFKDRQKYTITYNHLITFSTDSNIRFNEITPGFLKDFESYLKNTIGLEDGSVHTQQQNLRAVFRKGIHDGLHTWENYPYNHYTLPKRNPKRKEKLSEEELEKFEGCFVEKGTVEYHAKNAWLLSYYYGGIRVSDLVQLKVKNFRNGNLDYRMIKSKDNQFFKIFDQTKPILEEYLKEKSGDEYLLPFIDKNNNKIKEFINRNPKEWTKEEEKIFSKVIASVTSSLNNALERLRLKSEINKKITNHIAHHTFANLAKEHMSIEVLSAILGHESLSVTKNYIDDLDDETKNQAVENFHNRKKKSPGSLDNSN